MKKKIKTKSKLSKTEKQFLADLKRIDFKLGLAIKKLKLKPRKVGVK